VTDTPTAAFDAALDIAGHWATPPPSETIELIHNLVQAYALFADAGREADMAELFTPDAEWDGNRLGYGAAIGSEEIASLVCGHFEVGAPMMHLPGPSLLTAVSDTEVHGVSWCMATRWADGGTRPIIYFYYEDAFQRAGDGTWQFHRRRLHPAFPG
jgi:SnoaL-like domain